MSEVINNQNTYDKRFNLYFSLIETIPFPIYKKRITGEYVYCNRNFSKLIFNKEPDEIIGKTNEDLALWEWSSARYLDNNYDSTISKEISDLIFLPILRIRCSDELIHYFLNLEWRNYIINEDINILIEITDLFLYQKTLKTKEDILKTLFNNVQDLIVYKDITLKYSFVNAKFSAFCVELFEDIIGKTDYETFSKETADTIQKLEKSVLKENKSIRNFEINVLTKKNQNKWFALSIFPQLNENGNVVGLLEIYKDISDLIELRNKTNQLSVSEKAISKISAIILKHSQTNFKYALELILNELKELIDYDKIAFYELDSVTDTFKKFVELSKNSETCSDEINLNDLINLNRLALQNDIFLFENDQKDFVLTENEINFFNENQSQSIIFIPIIKFTNIHNFIISFHKKKVDNFDTYNLPSLKILSEMIANAFINYESEKFRQSAEEEMLKLSRAVNQSTNAILIMDKNGNIEYLNYKFTELTDFIFEDLVGKKPQFLIDKTTWDLNVVWETINSGKPFNEKFQFEGKNGKTFWGNVSLSPIKNANGELMNLLAIIEDITEKMIIDNRLAISSKLESIGQLAAGIAHEINTPMQFIGDNVSFLKTSYEVLINFYNTIENILKEKKDNNILEKLEELKNEFDINFLIDEIPVSIKQTEDGIERVTKIVRAMKNFAHQGTKEMTYSDINQGIEVTVTISRNEWKYVSDVELSLKKDLPLVYCHQDEINQVILNMIVNSAHAIEEKFSRSENKQGIIKIKTDNDDKFVFITIEDNGIGIRDEIKNRIYDPFFTTKQVGKGTGQGLAIAHDIITTKHKGTITLESEVGKGTKFLITLPINQNG